MLGRSHVIYAFGRGPLLRASMLINNKAFSGKISKAFSSIVLASQHTLNRCQKFSPTYLRISTAPYSRVLAHFTPSQVLDAIDIDTDAARRAFRNSNPFNDPEAHNCKIIFLPNNEDSSRKRYRA